MQTNDVETPKISPINWPTGLPLVFTHTVLLCKAAGSLRKNQGMKLENNLIDGRSVGLGLEKKNAFFTSLLWTELVRKRRKLLLLLAALSHPNSHQKH